MLVLEPRRLAARLAARRVASELGERVGETVGYQVRFEDVSGPRTRLRFLTEGVLTRRLLSDPTLAGVGTVILDEFHERHLDTDLALALLRRLPERIRLIVMSATLDAAPVAKYLGGCPVLRSEGKLYELAIEYTPHSPAPLEEQVAAALERLTKSGVTGDVLVFLPGAAEIRRAARAVEPLASRLGLLVLPLHGDLSPAEQDRAVSPADRPKVILSTNVAESSVTIEGVTAVIDSGLARVAADSPWTGLPSVEVRRISQASATQRAGRAGRTAPGRVIRLYSAEDFHRRPAADVPEILRRELSQLVLQLRAMKIGELSWLDQPAGGSIHGGQRAARPVGRHAGDGGAAAAAAARQTGARSEAQRRSRKRLRRRRGAQRGRARDHPICSRSPNPTGSRKRGESSTSSESASRDEMCETQMTRPSCKASSRRFPIVSRAIAETANCCFPEVARLVSPTAAGNSSSPSISRNAASMVFPWFVWPRRLSRNGCSNARRNASRFEWNRTAERVEQVTALVYDQLVIEETRAPAPPSEEASRLLAQKALEAGIGRFADRDAVEQLRSRAAFGGITVDAEAVLVAQCQGRTTFHTARSRGHSRCDAPGAHPSSRAGADANFPAAARSRFITNPASRPGSNRGLQDFFGMRESPKIGGAPVVVHLLAPNHRPVQVTSDLAGFWERLYPQVRKELARRYPKHKWPEKPV